MQESDLYYPIHHYLVDNGYTVNSEVQHTDIIAQKDDDLIAIELKKTFNATVLIQAVERQKFADSVYIAIVRPKKRSQMKNWKGMCRLMKRLELGLILVSFLKTKARIDIIFHPAEYTPRKSNKKKTSILREIENRSGNYNIGGVTRKKIITAYRENVIFIAVCLNKFSQLSPKQLRELGTGEKTGSILNKDFYGWFEKVEKGIYKLHSNGVDALEKYAEVADVYEKMISDN
ncbi:MAG: hypothetical protein GQ534_02515 [Candidatus Delongbacteria bacterium]|nr:hypothetical protein [Candidatus Delongbacteria bacterium]